MNNLEGLSREEIIRLIKEQAKKIDATVTKNEEGIAVMSRDDEYYTECVK
jgi:hypothetical protein